jgi:hypothetical protein
MCSAIVAAFLFIGETALMVGCSWARSATAPRAGVPTSAQLTIDVREPSGVSRSRWPVSVGVPFAPGYLRDVSGLSVIEGTTPAAVQARVLSRWPDGSVRWALLDWQMDLQPGQTRHWSVGTGHVAVEHSVKVADAGDRIDVDTGALQFSVAKNRFAPLTALRLNGTPVLAGPITTFFDVDGKRIEPQAPTVVKVVEPGPLRVRIELRGRYAADFDYVLRIDAFANQPFVRLLHTFEQHNQEPYTFVRQLAIAVPLKFEGPMSYSAGREKGPPFAGVVPEAGITLVQEDNETLRVGAESHAERAAGWIDARDASHGVALAARFFWQEYPQSFELRRSGLTYNLWAPGVPPAKVGMGAAKTHEMILYFHDKHPPAPALLAALSDPVVGHVDARWTVATGALRNGIAPGAETNAFLHELDAGYRAYQQHAKVERWDDSGQVRCPPPAVGGTPLAAPRPERPRRGFFGMFNWGDWNFPGYHDTTKGCDAWGNLEYDMTQVLALGYAATGERPYYEGMVAAARHFMDVDRIYYQRDRPNWVGMNHPKNPLHFAFELGGVDLGHTWTEGLLSYYYLTGDERGLDAARGIGDFLVRRSRNALRGNPRQWGWPQIALVSVYEATGVAEYKSAAQAYARGGMAAFSPDKIGGWKMGLLADGLAYTHSVTQDPVIRDWLVRYAAAMRARGADVDPRFLPAMAYVARLSGDSAQLRSERAAVARLKFGTWGKPFTIAGRIGFRMLSLGTTPLPRQPADKGAANAAPSG